MINWEKLYYQILIERVSIKGEKHHVIPKHDDGVDGDGIVVLEHKDHCLAHYIRWRWKGQIGDKVAYTMMSEQQINPMFIPEMVDKVKDTMNSTEQKERASKTQIKNWKDPEYRNKTINGRKKYFNSLEDKSILTSHMKECYKNRIGVYPEWMKDKEKFDNAIEKMVETNKYNYSLLTEEEKKEKFKNNIGINNPKWKGYYIVDNGENKMIFETSAELIKNTGLGMSTLCKYVNSGNKIKYGCLGGYLITRIKNL